MYDSETRSLWSQINGEAIVGPRKGERLTHLPATQTTWGRWKKLHPNTLVLAKEGRERSQAESVYSRYAQDPNRLGIFGTPNRDARLPGKAMIVGVRDANHALAIPVAGLRQQPVVSFTMNNEPFVAVFDPSSETTMVFSRRLDNRILDFKQIESKDGTVLLEDKSTQSHWNGLRGESTAGPLRGKQLRLIPTTQQYWFAWYAFFPNTEVWSSKTTP